MARTRRRYLGAYASGVTLWWAPCSLPDLGAEALSDTNTGARVALRFAMGGRGAVIAADAQAFAAALRAAHDGPTLTARGERIVAALLSGALALRGAR